jgi:ABC-type multidrug transport system ATPase subunit
MHNQLHTSFVSSVTHGFGYRKAEKQAYDKAKELLCALGLGESFDMKPRELSGGMSRRVAIARALCADYDALLLDEPFNGLDEEHVKGACDLILKELGNRPLVLVSHNKEHIEYLKGEIILI